MGKSTKDKRDVHYRSAKQEGYRARSAFKLLNLDKMLNGAVFHGVKRAVDLCAAPGSWSQVLSNRLYVPNKDDPSVKIVAVDFLEMVSIPGVIQMQGDVTEVSTAERILSEFQGEKVDLVVCDGAPDVTGFHDLDVFRHQDIVLGALGITTAILKEGGTMVMKVFKKESDWFLERQIGAFFRKMLFLKPESSRDSSLEMFAVGFDHYCPPGYSPRMLLDYFASKDLSKFSSTVLPFIIEGDLEGALPNGRPTSVESEKDARHESSTVRSAVCDCEAEESSTQNVCGDSSFKTSTVLNASKNAVEYQFIKRQRVTSLEDYLCAIDAECNGRHPAT